MVSSVRPGGSDGGRADGSFRIGGRTGRCRGSVLQDPKKQHKNSLQSIEGPGGEGGPNGVTHFVAILSVHGRKRSASYSRSRQTSEGLVTAFPDTQIPTLIAGYSSRRVSRNQLTTVVAWGTPRKGLSC
jgi:hypothetical protein